MLSTCLERLRSLAAGHTLRLPRFDKAEDDRADTADWPAVGGPVDVIVLEGWCLGSEAQDEEALARPVNSLEREADSSSSWRRFVNGQLAGPYAKLFAQLDLLVFLKVPNIETVYRWRLEQERKLAGKSSVRRAGIMNDAEVARFIQHFERVTGASLETLPHKADAVLELDERHDCVRLDIGE
jgi:D-glycerate 3-kinase